MTDNAYSYNTYTSPKRILVTGGAGFMGSHLCDRLIADGHDVICLDNFFSGRKRNIARLLGNHHFELVRHDITQPILLEVDWIFNLACPASPVHYQYNPVKTTKVNVLGALNVLGLAKRVRARVFQASTSEVYGDPFNHPQVEEYWGNVNPVGIRSCYDEGKRVAETLFFDYLRQNQVDIKVVRIFNTYGPRMQEDDGRVVSNFVIQALSGKDITIYGDGMQTRSFCYIDDMIEGMIRMMDYEENGSVRTQDYTRPCLSGFYGPLNLGNPEEMTMLELARTIIDLTGSRSRIIHHVLPEDDPKRRCPDISKVRKYLAWNPTVSIEKGLQETISYFKATGRAYRP